MIKVLQRINFSPSFCAWVELLYSTILSRILVNGHLSEMFQVSCGVQQGCPLSPLLYVLVSDTIGRAILNSPDIDGFQLPDHTTVKLGAVCGRYVHFCWLWSLFVRIIWPFLSLWESFRRLAWTTTSVTILGCCIGNGALPDWNALVEQFKAQLLLWEKEIYRLEAVLLWPTSLASVLFGTRPLFSTCPKPSFSLSASYYLRLFGSLKRYVTVAWGWWTWPVKYPPCGPFKSAAIFLMVPNTHGRFFLHIMCSVFSTKIWTLSFPAIKPLRIWYVGYHLFMPPLYALGLL